LPNGILLLFSLFGRFQGQSRGLTLERSPPFLSGEFLRHNPVSPCAYVLGITNGDVANIADIETLGGIWGLKARQLE
jgi:hypothetical protein